MADSTATDDNTSEYRLIAFQVVVSILITFIPFLRFWLLWGKLRSATALAADLLFGTVWLITAAMHWVDVWVSVQMLSPSADTNYELGWSLAEIVLYIPILWSIKAAFLCFYWDIGGRIPSRKFRYLLYGTAIWLLITLAVLVTVILTYCRPLSRTWDINSIFTETAGYCSPAYGLLPQTFWIVCTVSTDISILTIPLLIVHSLDLSRLEKRILPVVFFIGLLTIITPLVRYFASLRQGLLSSHPILEKALPAGASEAIIVYAWIESLAAFLAFSMPAFRFLLTKAFRAKLRTKARAWTTGSRISRLFSKGRQQIPLPSEPELALESNPKNRELTSVEVINDAERQSGIRGSQ